MSELFVLDYDTRGLKKRLAVFDSKDKAIRYAGKCLRSRSGSSGDCEFARSELSKSGVCQVGERWFQLHRTFVKGAPRHVFVVEWNSSAVHSMTVFKHFDDAAHFVKSDVRKRMGHLTKWRIDQEMNLIQSCLEETGKYGFSSDGADGFWVMLSSAFVE